MIWYSVMGVPMIAIVLILCAGLVILLLKSPIAWAQESSNASLILGFIDPRIRISDIFTFVPIFISVVTIFLTLQKEKNLRQKEQADKVRTAVAKTIANLRSWRDISFSLFNELDNVLDNSIKGAGDSIEFTNIIDKELKKLRKDICECSPKDSIAKYESIYEYDPSVGFFFSGILERLRDEAAVMFDAGLRSGSSDVINDYLKNGCVVDHKIEDRELRELLLGRIGNVEVIYRDQINYLALEAIIRPLQYLFIFQDISRQTKDRLLSVEMNNEKLDSKKLLEILFMNPRNTIDADNNRKNHKIRRLIYDPIESFFTSQNDEDILKNREIYLKVLLNSIPGTDSRIYLPSPEEDVAILNPNSWD
jgi:hypothetical protein